MKLRIKFRKYGNMKFIGHLDVMRYFQKAIRRADIDIRYSEGFSPHQIMSFAAPLGVGITSNGEYVDIDLLSMESTEDVKKRLSAAMTEGFEIVGVRLLPDSAGNAMSLVAAADYTVRLRPGYEMEQPLEWMRGLADFYRQPSIIVKKKTKKGEKELDLKPLVYELVVCVDEPVPYLFMRISNGSAANIKPELVLDAYYASLGQERPAFAWMQQREEVYGDAASEEERLEGRHRFVSLMELDKEA